MKIDKILELLKIIHNNIDIKEIEFLIFNLKVDKNILQEYSYYNLI
jgi:hypothetical protein